MTRTLFRAGSLVVSAPLDESSHPILKINGPSVSKVLFSFLRIADPFGDKGLTLRFVMDVPAGPGDAKDQLGELFDRGSNASPQVIAFAGDLPLHGKHVCPCAISDTDEVILLAAISKDHRRPALIDAVEDLMHHRRVRSPVVLPGSVDVHVTQLNPFQPVLVAKALEEMLSGNTVIAQRAGPGLSRGCFWTLPCAPLKKVCSYLSLPMSWEIHLERVQPEGEPGDSEEEPI